MSTDNEERGGPKALDIADLWAAGVDLADLMMDAEIVQDEEPESADGDDQPPPPDAPGDHAGGEEVDGWDDADPQHLTDLGNSRVFVELAKGDLRWCGAMPGKGWMVWDGSRWALDEDRTVTRHAFRVCEEWRARAPDEVKIVDTMDEEEAAKAKKQNAIRKAMLAWAKKSESAGTLAAMVDLAAAHPSVSTRQSAWDADPWLFGTPEATYDLKACRSHKPRRRELMTRRGAVTASGDCPIWLGFLDKIMGGDRGMIEFLQRAAGYTLTGCTDEHCFFICHGNGRNGKGTFIETLRYILGDYARTAATETFLDRKQGAIPNDLAALAGARMIVVSEPDEGAKLAEGIVKMVTGGDTITARFLNREFFDFLPIFKFWMLTNHIPRIDGTDDGIWSRIRLIPFTVTIPEGERDRHLMVKLRAEAPGILRWMLAGLKEWQRVGLSPPPGVIKATQEYRADMDVLGDFLADRCILPSKERAGDPDFRAQNGPLYAAYAEWAKDNGMRPKSHKGFTRAMQDRGFRQDPDRSGGRYWWGLRLALAAAPRQTYQRAGEA